MATIRSSNNPDMLVWAREAVGYSVEQAAEAIGVSVKSLTAAETGEKSLTLKQLRKAAEKYNCPFGYFYFSEPPHKNKDKPVPDFRIEPSVAGVENFRLQLEIKRVRDRRLVYIDLLAEQEEKTKPFELLASKSTKKNIGSSIRTRLGVSQSDLARTGFDKVYAYWKNKIESDGVLVYESQYIPEDTGVIGLAISYEKYPIILIKRGAMSNARKLFTLLHEYAHLLKGKSAINDIKSQTTSNRGERHSKLEADCNRLAAEILVPSELFLSEDYDDMTPPAMMEKVAEKFKVTFTTAAVCLRQRELITHYQYQSLINERQEIHRKKKDKNINKEARIPRENIQRLDMGRPFFNAVLSAYDAGRIDVYDASNILNLRVKKIDVLIERSNQ